MRLPFHSAALTAAALVGAAAQAQIPSTAPYVTDPQNAYVQDDTSQGIGNLNMVLCIIGALDPGDMVNSGPYIALVDVDKCNNKGGGSNSSATGATNYATAVVNVTRASNSDPMIGKVWMSLTQQGQSMNVYAYLSATQSPTDAPPYGVFRMDYIGKMNGQTGFNGYVNSQPGTISFLETGPQSSNTELAMSAGSTTSGTGSMSIANGGGGSGLATFNFAYNSAYFRRSDGTNDECFDRSKANASVSVWQYGTYNANDGSRVDQAFPGFPILATYNSATYYGFANYWGINFQGLDLNSIADASPLAGLTVTDQRPGNSTAYNLSKVGGKLTKWTKVATTLAALDGLPFTFGADLTNQTSDTTDVSGWNNWIAQWNSSNQTFTVTGIQSCGNNGCVPSPLPNNAGSATINVTFLNTNPIMGWSDSFGGNLNIPATGSVHTVNDAVYYFTQSTVIPGSSGEPAALYCLSQCPTAAALAAFPTGGSSASPFGNSTGQQWFSAPSANTVSYTFGATGLMESGTAMVLESPSQYPSGSMYQNGIMTGRMFDTALTSANCPSGMPAGTVCEPANPAYYYTWQTGSNQWSQSLWLTKASDNSVVPFDAPQNIPYTVPTGTAYANFAGKSILLQFNGFGNLSGIPGYCVDPVTNATVNCSQNARYVPMFSIPDGATMTLPGTPSIPLIVKALDAEIRLKNLGASASSPCASMSLSAMTLPSGGTHDPSNSGDSEYLGTMPSVTGAPKVVDGVVQ
jgi:hypothetical protein